MSKPETIKIDDVTYIREDSINSKAQSFEGMECVIVRTYSAGVFMGYLKERNGKECVLVNARRLWQWSGAASLSQLSVDGVKNPNQCKFPCVIPWVMLTEAIEILPVSEKAKNSIDEVPVWEI